MVVGYILTIILYSLLLNPMYHAEEHHQLSGLLDSYKDKKSSLSEEDFRNFCTRLSANFHIIKRLFVELYGHRNDYNAHFEQLIDLLFMAFDERHHSLKTMDSERERNPRWLLSQKWVGMMLYPEHFAKDLMGFLDKLDYLQELGINWIHLMPLLQSPSHESDGGYAVSDYRKVNPKFGTMADIRKIAKEFREREMLLTLDLVLNHTSRDHSWAQKALKGDKTFQDYYYMFDDRLIPDQFENYMPEIFPVSAPGNFTYLESIEKWVMTVFHQYQWDLNYRNPQVFCEMMGNLLFLANQGVDLLRLDAPAFLWKKMGTNCQNLGKAHLLLKLMKRCSEVVAPGVKFIAEAIVAPHEIMRYFGENIDDKECEIAYHAPLMALLWEALATGEVRLMEKALQNLPPKPQGTTWINYVRCHDDIGLGFDDQHIYELGLDAQLHRTYILEFYTGKFEGSPSKGAPFMFNPKNGDARISGTLASLAGLETALQSKDKKAIDTAINRITLLHSIIMSFGGLPLIYSGDEIGLVNDYSYQKDVSKAYDNRWMHRPVMDWKAADRRHREGTIEQRIFTNIQTLINIRKQTPEWADLNNCTLVYCENKHVIAYLRWSDHGLKSLVLANFHNSTQFIKKDIVLRHGFDIQAGLIDAITGKAPKYRHELLVFEPYQFYWLGDRRRLNTQTKGKKVTTIAKQ